MSLIAVGTLFPAIPLAIVALNFRYTSLAGLMRQITSQLEASTPDGPGEAVLIDELTVMKKRMTLVKYALFLCGVAFIFNLAALYLGYFSPGRLEPAMMALTILSMVGGISCFCVETVLSTKALNLHISGVLYRDPGRPRAHRHSAVALSSIFESVPRSFLARGVPSLQRRRTSCTTRQANPASQFFAWPPKHS